MSRVKQPQQIYVGTFTLGSENVDLYAIKNDIGGQVFTRPDNKSVGRIRIGIDYKHWDEVVGILLHETLEYAAIRAGVRFRGNHDGSDNYMFVMDHNRFSEICQNQGWFVADAIPKLQAVWRKFKS